jgi:hypothetical protein
VARTLGFNEQERRLLRRLSTPVKLQDFLETIPINFAYTATCRSPRRVLRERRAHCLEGAMLAAAALWLAGQRPLLFDLQASDDDQDHVVALFRRYGCWGAVSKTNHAVLRYREPVYRTLRELAVSYFHEYFLDSGRKTLRAYSVRPLDLRRFARRGWATDERDLWYVNDALDALPHAPLLGRTALRHLRLADGIEVAAGKLTQWPPG